VLVWTATGVGQCIAYSTDRGRTFTAYEHNPVIPMRPDTHGDWDRDPKVYWHEPTGRWVMALSISGKGFAFYSSPDLKRWTQESVLPDLWECPDYFELPVDGKSDQKKWVIWDASGKYFIGSFDGRSFTKESGPFLIDYGHNYYAAQTWNHAPDGRRIGIAWMREGRYPDMPFNQQMSVPFELSLRTLPQGVRLVKVPVKEIESLRQGTKEVKDQALGRVALDATDWGQDGLDIEAELEPRGALQVVLKARGAMVEYVPGLLKCQGYSAPLEPAEGRIKLRVLIDRTSVEVFANDGAASISATYLAPDDQPRVELSAEHGGARLMALQVHRLKSTMGGQ
jgi:sucrose-6-phosphate hydrolase SacC (GH32 family)